MTHEKQHKVLLQFLKTTARHWVEFAGIEAIYAYAVPSYSSIERGSLPCTGSWAAAQTSAVATLRIARQSPATVLAPWPVVLAIQLSDIPGHGSEFNKPEIKSWVSALRGCALVHSWERNFSKFSRRRHILPRLNADEGWILMSGLERT